MPRSTGKFISYDLRPAKQSERMMLVDLLKAGGDSGLPIRDYRYVGMGANRFYDFLLIHRYLGITKMISLEHDDKFVERARFNAPYKFIEVENNSAADFIAADTSVSPSVYWLDYDGGIGGHIIGDITSLSNRIKIGDFCFVTAFGGPPKVIDRVSDADRLVWLQDNLGDVSGTVLMEDVEKANFPDAVHKILMAGFQNAFAPRMDGKFIPLLQVEYSDTMPMVTVGGAFLSEGQAVGIRGKLKSVLPFLETSEHKLYEIRSLHLTERERQLFDGAVTAKGKRCKERNKLKELGFKDAELGAYKDLLRYLPRYVEAIV
ncbi:O-methyltransferase [Sphingomonas sp. RT2P30]|uniref:O-methyltransferase n=1 Tax=Parasphingomonas halimpatiens TaxID=3096162 RepID=UPI002FC9C4ED